MCAHLYGGVLCAGAGVCLLLEQNCLPSGNPQPGREKDRSVSTCQSGLSRGKAGWRWPWEVSSACLLLGSAGTLTLLTFGAADRCKEA